MLFMHLSIVSPTTPCMGIGQDNRRFDPVLPSNSPLLGQLIKSPLKAKVPVIPWNHVGNLIHHIVSTVKVNTCTIHRIYHIMGFRNWWTAWVCRCSILRCKSQLCKKIYRSQIPHYRGGISQSNKVNCSYNPDPSLYGGGGGSEAYNW